MTVLRGGETTTAWGGGPGFQSVYGRTGDAG